MLEGICGELNLVGSDVFECLILVLVGGCGVQRFGYVVVIQGSFEGECFFRQIWV